MPKNAKIINVSSNYILHYIFSYLKYNEALKLIKYDKKLQNKLNLKLNDYSIDYKIDVVEEFREIDVLNKINVDGPPIIFYLSLTLKIIFILIVIYNLSNFRYNACNVFLIIGLVYIFCSLFYLMTKKFFGVKGDLGCLKCFYITDNIIYFILLIITLVKLLNDKKNKLDIYYSFFIKINTCMLISACLIFFMQCLHNYFFFKEENLLKFDEKAIGHRREKVKKEHVFINKFRGFKIDTFEYNNASNFKPLRYSTIQSLLKNNLYYTISPKQANLINIINNFRKKNNINQLKSNSAVKLIYYFDKIEHFFSLGNLFQFNNYKTYLFVYPIGEFEYKLRNNDDVIIKILKIKSLNYIIILEKENNEYILIFEEKQYIIKSMNNDIQLSSRSNTSNVLLINNFAI